MDVYVLLVGLLAVAIGLAFTFFGYRLFMILLPIWGAVVGFFFGASLAAALFGTPFLGDASGYLLGILFAVLFGIGAYLWYWLAVAVLAGSFGYAIGLALAGALGIGDRTPALIVALVVAVLFAIAAIWLGLPRYLAIGFTAVAGAFTAVAAVAVLLGELPPGALEAGSIGAYIGRELSPLWLIAALVLTAVGIVYQLVSTGEVEPVEYSRYRNPWRRGGV